MSFPNKWNQFVAPTQSKAAANRRNYWKFDKRHRGKNNNSNNIISLNEQRPAQMMPAIRPLWNGCISVRNQYRDNSSAKRQQLVQTNVRNNGQTVIKSKYFARLNNDLRELWQIETPLNNMYAPSTSIPSFSVNLSGSLFANKKHTSNLLEANPQTQDPIICESGRLSPFVAPNSPPHVSVQQSHTSLDFPSFSHASPTFEISSLTNCTVQRQAKNELSIYNHESCIILPQLTFYDHICSTVNSVCEASINKLYPQNKTTMESILQQFSSQLDPSDRLMDETDWPFSPMTNHGNIRDILSSAQSFGTTVQNYTDVDGQDASAISKDVSDRLF